MRIALIFDKTRADTTGIYFERACRSLGLPADHWWLRDAASMPHDYDLYLRIDHGDDYLVAMPDGCRPSVFYATDTHLRHSWKKIRRVAPRYDAVFCCHREAAERLRGAEWLPVAGDPTLPANREGVNPAPSATDSGPCDDGSKRFNRAKLHGSSKVCSAGGGVKRYDVAFVGTDGGRPRKFYLQALRERYPKSFIGKADYRDMMTIYGQARIGFNYSIGNDVNMRIFEILTAQTLLVTNALANNDLSCLGLEDRRHLILYHRPAEVFELIDYYLGHPEEREQIAEAGADIARQRHTYVHRMRQLLVTVSRRLGVPLPNNLQELVRCES